MSFLSKLKSRLHEVSQAIGDSLDFHTVDDEIKNFRLDICNKCEFLFEPTGQCKKCGCFVKAKTALAGASCPIKKWPIVEIVDSKE